MNIMLHQNRLRSVRRALDDLYVDLDTDLGNEPGAWTTKMSVSDAIDAINKAISSCPTDAVEVPRAS